MTDYLHFEQLLGEFKRVGVDPDTFSATLAVRPEDALRALRELPDGAGPGAFLARLRQLGVRPAGGADRTAPPQSDRVAPDANGGAIDRTGT